MIELATGGTIRAIDTSLQMMTPEGHMADIDISNPTVKLHIVRWAGRLWDALSDAECDVPVYAGLLTAPDIPRISLHNGLAVVHLNWIGGSHNLVREDIEGLLLLLGQSSPPDQWRNHCRHMAAKDGIVLDDNFFN